MIAIFTCKIACTSFISDLSKYIPWNSYYTIVRENVYCLISGIGLPKNLYPRVTLEDFLDDVKRKIVSNTSFSNIMHACDKFSIFLFFHYYLHRNSFTSQNLSEKLLQVLSTSHLNNFNLLCDLQFVVPIPLAETIKNWITSW